MRMSLTWLLSSGCFCICLSINTLFCQEPTTTILAERTLRDHRCVRREARSRVINYGVCLGSKPAPTPTLALEQQDQINCTGKCIMGGESDGILRMRTLRGSELSAKYRLCKDSCYA
jgi:hypothetical protein